MTVSTKDGKKCSCGSGELRQELHDAAGNFCTFVCDQCRSRKMRAFKSFIFDPDTTYARTGNEMDIPVEKIKREI